MELNEQQALVQLLFIGASVDNRIEDSEIQYIKAVCAHEEIEIDLLDIKNRLFQEQSELLYHACIFKINQQPLEKRLKALVYLFEMLLSDDLFLDEEDYYFKRVLKDLHVSENQFRHAPTVFQKIILPS